MGTEKSLSNKYKQSHNTRIVNSSFNIITMTAPPPPTGVPMEGLVSTAPQPEPSAAVQPPKPTEVPCETLYIQNLNEKIKPDGAFLINNSVLPSSHDMFSYETNPSWLI